MRGHAETKEERRGQSNAGTPKEPSLLESVAHNARAAASSLQRNIVNDSNNAAHVPSQQELPGEQLRRTSLGLFGPDVFFNLSDHQNQQLDHRRSSFGFGGDFDFQGQHQQQLQQQQVQNGTTASTLSIDSAGLGPTANAYFVQGGFEQTANNNAPVYPQQRAFFGFGGQQQQQQSQQNISASDRVRAEAQAAAAAIFLGGPLPGSNDDNENSNQRQNQNFFGAVPLQNALPNNSQQFGRMRQLYSNTRNDNNTSSQCDISSLSMNGPQIQQQRNLTHHSLDMSRIQQLQQQLQYQQQQQLQQQQQQQQIMGRHSFGLPMTPSDAPFQQVQRGPQQVQASFSISDQLRQHQQHLEELNRGPASADAAATSSEQQDKPESLRIKKGKKKSIKSSPDVASPSSFTGGKKDPPFPQKLHEILSNPEYEEIICWMPHGKSWRILKPTAFEHQVIPLHFRHSKYASFMRQVSLLLNFTPCALHCTATLHREVLTSTSSM